MFYANLSELHFLMIEKGLAFHRQAFLECVRFC